MPLEIRSAFRLCRLTQTSGLEWVLLVVVPVHFRSWWSLFIKALSGSVFPVAALCALFSPPCPSLVWDPTVTSALASFNI